MRNPPLTMTQFCAFWKTMVLTPTTARLWQFRL